MKTLVKYLFFLILFVFSATVVVGLFLPSDYFLSRRITIAAPISAVHVYVGDLAQWESWSPWKDGDPSLLTTLGPITEGVGATSSWKGRDGEGNLIVTASDSAKGIEYDLFFDQGKWKSTARINYSVVDATNTTVVWEMEGSVEAPVIGGYFALLMDRMVGPMYEIGLARLKERVESSQAGEENEAT